MDGNRRTLRYSVELAATLVVADRAIVCVVRDISLGGVFVQGALLDAGTRGMLRFATTGLTGIKVSCAARWHDDRGTGMQFAQTGVAVIDETILATLIRASRAIATDPVPG